MADDVFPDVQVDYGSGKDNAPKISEYQFGDGYSQRVGNGINSDLEEWPVSWKRPNSDIEEMDAFLKSKKGYIPFLWTPPPYYDANGTSLSQRRVICKKWHVAYSTGMSSILSGTFIEVADI